MNTGGRETDDNVTGNYFVSARQEIAPFDRADRETRQVVLPVGVHVRHLGRFPTNLWIKVKQKKMTINLKTFRWAGKTEKKTHQTAVRAFAAFDDAGDDALCDVDIETPAREIIKEEKRFGAVGEDVVDAHRDEIDADGVVDSALDRNL